MEELIVADKSLSGTADRYERDFKAQINKLSGDQTALVERLNALNQKKLETARANGNTKASAHDLVEVNAGGKIIAAKRSTLTQPKGTRMEALFSGRWDKICHRDHAGRLFLDINPHCFQSIIDYLNERTISSEDNPPERICVDEEHMHILQQQLRLFGLLDTIPMVKWPDTTILKEIHCIAQLHSWLHESSSDGDLSLLYRSSRNGRSSRKFHSKCDNKGPTLTLVETTDGFIVGGYSNVAWSSSSGKSWSKKCWSKKAFLFVLPGGDITCPRSMKLKASVEGDAEAVCGHSSYGPMFGSGHDLCIEESTLHLKFGHSYEPGPPGKLSESTSMRIKEIEVFRINRDEAKMPASTTEALENIKQVNRFSTDINEAVNKKQKCLVLAESEISSFEASFKDEQDFITDFISGKGKDLVTLNVSGTNVMTKRSTLQAIKDSVLAQQFDETKWTEQGCLLRAETWTPEDVQEWASNIDGIQENAAIIFTDNKINGSELLAMNMDGLKMMGIERPGTMCLLLSEIEKLEKTSQGAATLIEHSPYCFGKIIDYLRLKQLHSQGLVDNPAAPKVCHYQKNRFEKVVKYYFPCEGIRFILG